MIDELERYRKNFPAYFTPEGEPTCSAHWETARCKLLRVSGMCGKYEICGYTELTLKRREEQKNHPTGYLIPCEGCPLHD